MKVKDLTFDIIPSTGNIPTFILNNLSDYNNYFVTKYKGWEVSTIYENSQGDIIQGLLNLDVTNLIIANTYKYNTLYNTTRLTYDPIANVDGTETITTTKEGSEINRGLNTFTPGATSTTKSKASAYDDTELRENAEDITTSSGEDNTEYSNTKTFDNYKETVQNIRKGNIGVTSTQNLIEQERNIALFSIIDIVCTDIAHLILLGVYPDE